MFTYNRNEQSATSFSKNLKKLTKLKLMLSLENVHLRYSQILLFNKKELDFENSKNFNFLTCTF